MEASAREEVLAPPELHFVEVLGMRILAEQALHGRDGLFGAAELVVRPRSLIEDLVSLLIIRILVQQPVIESDGLKGTVGISAHRVRRRGVGVTAPHDSGLRCRAPLEILIGLLRGGGRIGRAAWCARKYPGGLRGGHFPWLDVASAYPELLLEL